MLGTPCADVRGRCGDVPWLTTGHHLGSGVKPVKLKPDAVVARDRRSGRCGDPIIVKMKVESNAPPVMPCRRLRSGQLAWLVFATRCSFGAFDAVALCGRRRRDDLCRRYVTNP